MMRKNENIKITLVGMGDHAQAMLPEGKALLKQHTVFSGGKRHHELLKEQLPANYQWLPISGSMETVIASYSSIEVPLLVITSGDPLFYGFGNTLIRRLPAAELTIIPWFNSLQRLCHKVKMNYNDLTAVTLHGRPWHVLDEALINEKPLIGILTDSIHSPSKIAARLLAYGYSEYELIVGEHLDGKQEKVQKYSLKKAATMESKPLNCVLLKTTHQIKRPRLYQDSRHKTLASRPGMMTKTPIRALTVKALELERRTHLWDIGACTGSVAIACKRSNPSLAVKAFEIRNECKAIIRENQYRLATPGIEVFIGDFLEKNLDAFAKPDAVFIGGHGNRLQEIIQRIDQYLAPGGIVVMNTVKETSAEVFQKAFQALGYQLEAPIAIAINTYNPIKILAVKKKSG